MERTRVRSMCKRRHAFHLAWIPLSRPAKAQEVLEDVQKRLDSLQGRLDALRAEERILNLELSDALSERSAAIARSKGILPKVRGVMEIFPETWDEIIGQERITFVEFYATWCPYCKRLEPTWEQLAEEVESRRMDVQIARLDGDKHYEFMERYGAEGFPTLIAFQEGRPTGYYRGKADVESLLKYIS